MSLFSSNRFILQTGVSNISNTTHSIMQFFNFYHTSILELEMKHLKQVTRMITNFSLFEALLVVAGKFFKSMPKPGDGLFSSSESLRFLPRFFLGLSPVAFDALLAVLLCGFDLTPVFCGSADFFTLAGASLGLFWDCCFSGCGWLPCFGGFCLGAGAFSLVDCFTSLGGFGSFFEDPFTGDKKFS